MYICKKLKGIILCVSVIFMLGCSTEPNWLKPSGSAAGVPADQSLAFEDYIADSRNNIKSVLTKHRFSDGASPYVGNYSVDRVVDMRAPFQLPVNANDVCKRKVQGAGTGYLLIHGLTDSPYLLRGMAESIAKEQPCALIRAVLLPGHGTIVGDTVNMKYQDWQAITEYGVNSLEKMNSIENIYILGFSTGTALAIKHVKELKETKVKGLVLISTALKASSNLAWLTSYIKGVKPWLDKKIERDAARYSSFSANAGSQFYKLTRNLMDQKYATDMPVLMAVSADDATVNAEAARTFFCQNVNSERKLMLWYQGFSTKSNVDCDGIVEIKRANIAQEYKDKKYRYANLAHTGVSIAPDDLHYGVDGIYHDCKFYEKNGDDSLWEKCMADNELTVFAEKNIQNMDSVLEGNLWRRGTFNQDYEHLVEKILCFTQLECSL